MKGKSVVTQPKQNGELLDPEVLKING